MPARASGFCIYNDPALAIGRARQDGLRVLYVDLDVHHGDGVQAIHWSDAGVLTFSIHETGRYLFPGTGGVGELGVGTAAGTAINVPLEPYTGEGAWLPAVESLVPELAAAFGPDVVVSQHGADSHAWDPLAHLNMTTTAMSAAARLVDDVAHRYAKGRWLATGGGGYDAYRVVPRSWSLVWLAGAHRDVPASTPGAWRDRWAGEGARYGQTPPPETFTDLPNAGEPMEAAQDAADERSAAVARLARRVTVPRLLREARDRGWWDPSGSRSPHGASSSSEAGSGPAPTIVPTVDVATWSNVRLAARTLAPADPADGHALIAAGLRQGALHVSAAVDGDLVVGAVVSLSSDGDGPAAILGLGVAPPWRRHGLADQLLRDHVDALPTTREVVAEITVGERDPFDPIDGEVRRGIARRMLERGGFATAPTDPAVRAADPATVTMIRRP
jgi:GNAT superfamily N-acetyltransferase